MPGFKPVSIATPLLKYCVDWLSITQPMIDGHIGVDREPFMLRTFSAAAAYFGNRPIID